MSMRKRKKVQILSREELRLRRWDFRLVPSERGLEAVGKSVHLYIISRDNHIDLFPHTSAVEKMAILRSKKPLIYSRERTAQSGGLLTSIWSNRATWRRSAGWSAAADLALLFYPRPLIHYYYYHPLRAARPRL